MRNAFEDTDSQLSLAQYVYQIYNQAMEVALVWAAQQGANITYLNTVNQTTNIGTT